MSRFQKHGVPREVLAATSATANFVAIRPVENNLAQHPQLDPLLARAMPHVAAGHYEKAFSTLASGGSAPVIQNARGVCLMRLGRYEDAVRLYRGLVLQAGGTWSKPDIPTIHKTNFATALLLEGHPSGCETMLAEVQNESHPAVIRLRQAIARWQTTLTFTQRLNWWFGRLEPPHCRITLDFMPGDFVDEQPDAAGEKSLLLGAYPPSVEQR